MQLTTMIKSSALLALATSFVLVAGSAAPNVLSPSIEGYTTGFATFNGTYNGHAYTLEGTIRQVADKLESLYGPLVIANEPRDISPIRRRNKRNLICIPVPGQNWVKGSYDGINADITTLKSIGGALKVNARQCAQLSCHDSSAVKLCNDNDYPISPQLDYLASYAQDLVNDCSDNIQNPRKVGGQEFDTDNYNVIAKGEFCTV